jgi:hypothetical protein
VALIESVFLYAQVANLSITASLEVIKPTPSPPPVCRNATCFYAAPVWVPDNSSNSSTSTMYVPSYPRRPVFEGTDAACADPTSSNGTDSQPDAADTLSLDGLSVAVTSTVIPGVSMVGATIDFWGADAFNITTRPWDASAADIDASVRWAIPGFNPSVTRERYALKVSTCTPCAWR